jgi:hypothetical protein
MKAGTALSSTNATSSSACAFAAAIFAEAQLRGSSQVQRAHQGGEVADPARKANRSLDIGVGGFRTSDRPERIGPEKQAPGPNVRAKLGKRLAVFLRIVERVHAIEMGQALREIAGGHQGHPEQEMPKHERDRPSVFLGL